jgi:hypothetical protein
MGLAKTTSGRLFVAVSGHLGTISLSKNVSAFPVIKKGRDLKITPLCKSTFQPLGTMAGVA